MLETTILLVDPTASQRAETERALASEFPAGTIRTADSYEDALSQLSETVDAVVTRYTIGDSNGIELTAYLRENWPEIDCFLYAETTEIETESFEAAVVEFVPRETPSAVETVAELIKQADVATGQRQYPHPAQDQERTAVLDSYLEISDNVTDTLERITTLATDHFDGETAAIAVLEERTQQILAQSGPLSLPEHREDTINTYTLVHEEPVMMVPDYEDDPRFTYDGFESGGVGSYLGAQIRTTEGYVLGTVSIYDNSPRTYAKSERSYLETLAALTADVLEVHRQLTDERDSSSKDGDDS